MCPLASSIVATRCCLLHCEPVFGRPTPPSPSTSWLSRDPFPALGGTNIFAQRPPPGRLYVFPPFSLVVPLIRLFAEWGDVEVVLVLLAFPGRSAKWAAWLRPFIQDSFALCSAGSVGVLFPFTSGFIGNRLPLAFGLTAFRCVFPATVRPPQPAPLPQRRTLFFADSMLRPLEKLFVAFSAASARLVLLWRFPPCGGAKLLRFPASGRL